MRRYESPDGKRFWEVAVSTDGLTIRTGNCGTDGKLSFKPMGLEDARALADKRIATKLKAGFALVIGADTGEARDPGLEETIAADPENPAGYQIYADWLQEKGERRGELIALDVEPTDDAAGKKITKARKAFLKSHPDYDLPPRFGALASKRRKKNQSRGTACEAVWRHGFVAEATVGIEKSKPHTLRELVLELLAHPSARFLHTLRIGALGKRGVYDYAEVADQIALAGPRALRELTIAEFDEDSSALVDSRLDDIGPLLAALPGLRRLNLEIGHVGLATLEHANLEALSLTIDTLSDANLAAIDGLALPRLTSLRVNANDAALPARAFAQLLASPPPELRELQLRRMRDTEPVVRALLASPLGRQLRSLDLSFGTIMDGPAILTTDAIGHLEALDVTGNYMTDDFEAVLAERVAQLAFRDQRENTAGYHQVTEGQVRNFAPDAKSITAARKVAKAKNWPRLGREPEVLWGECAGSSSYEVFARVDADMITDAACTCPSRKYPCKHALALLLLAANGHRFPREAIPSSLESNAASARYESSWE